VCNEVELRVVLLSRNVVCLFTFGTRSKIRPLMHTLKTDPKVHRISAVGGTPEPLTVRRVAGIITKRV